MRIIGADSIVVDRGSGLKHIKTPRAYSPVPAHAGLWSGNETDRASLVPRLSLAGRAWERG